MATSTREDKDEVLKRAFLKASGYKESAVDKVDSARGVVLTTNGGKYHVTSKGIRTLSGPEYPKTKREDVATIASPDAGEAVATGEDEEAGEE